MLQVFLLSCLFAITFAQNGCPPALLEARINMTDFPNMVSRANLSNETFAFYERFDLCRSHSKVNPLWLSSTILTLSFRNKNTTYYTIFHYNSCNSSSSRFADPIILIDLATNDSLSSLQRSENPNADFCYDCFDSSTGNYCRACNDTCETSDPNAFEFCYGPMSNQCCHYTQNSSCVNMCPPNYFPGADKDCVFCHITCGGNGKQSNASCNCICDPGYSGVNCEEFVCDPDPCQNGNCSVSWDSNYTCLCDTNYSGRNCTIFDFCSSSPCVEGNCSSNSTDFTCSCNTGYSGITCEVDIDPCDPDPCGNGTCIMISNSQYTCNCNSGYTGMNCTTPISGVDPCSPNPCHNGTCLENSSTYTCTCPSDRVGINCTTTNPCSRDSALCSNNGVCRGMNTSPYFTCDCNPGVNGSKCEYNAKCNNTVNPCLNNGNCTAVNATAFGCQCTRIWVDEVCRDLVNPCNSNVTNQCMNGGNCSRTFPDPYYRCSCGAEYTGTNCETAIGGGGASASSVAVVAGAIVGVLFILIILVAVAIIIGIAVWFYLKSKRGKVEIAKKKTSKVYPTNGEPSIIDEEKKPML